MTVFFPSLAGTHFGLCEVPGHIPKVYVPNRFYISSKNPVRDGIIIWTISQLQAHPAFARFQDCEIAIRSLTEAGYVTEDHLREIDDQEFLQICCRDLLW